MDFITAIKHVDVTLFRLFTSPSHWTLRCSTADRVAPWSSDHKLSAVHEINALRIAVTSLSRNRTTCIHHTRRNGDVFQTRDETERISLSGRQDKICHEVALRQSCSFLTETRRYENRMEKLSENNELSWNQSRRIDLIRLTTVSWQKIRHRPGSPCVHQAQLHIRLFTISADILSALRDDVHNKEIQLRERLQSLN